MLTNADNNQASMARAGDNNRQPYRQLKVEDALVDIDAVKRIRTSISEGSASLMVEFEDGADIDGSVEDLERALDRLENLPTTRSGCRSSKSSPTCR